MHGGLPQCRVGLAGPAGVSMITSRQISDQGTAILRRAHAVRLRALHHKPDLAGVDKLIEIITPEVSQYEDSPGGPRR
jgi:hypothetical protein